VCYGRKKKRVAGEQFLEISKSYEVRAANAFCKAEVPGLTRNGAVKEQDKPAIQGNAKNITCNASLCFIS